jgi:glyoxylase-like metal-dependent hydrolase (beta-lactamase superfamily II)
MPLQQLHPNLWIHQSRYYQTNAGIFRDGEQAILVDPGIAPEEIDEIANFVTSQRLRVSTILVTHSHWDHILGVERFPHARTITHQRFNEELRSHNAETLRLIGSFDKENSIQQRKKVILPTSDITFSSSMELASTDLGLRLIHAPGHASDQFVVFYPEGGILWAADMLSDAEIPFTSHSVEAYHGTLHQLMGLDVKLLVPGHGHPTDRSDEIKNRFLEDLAYLQDLRERAAEGVRGGCDAVALVNACRNMPFRNPQDNSTPHDWNVETAYLEAGGKPAGGLLGWAKEWSAV